MTTIAAVRCYRVTCILFVVCDSAQVCEASRRSYCAQMDDGKACLRKSMGAKVKRTSLSGTKISVTSIDTVLTQYTLTKCYIYVEFDLYD